MNKICFTIWLEANKIKLECNALTYIFHAKISICHSVIYTFCFTESFIAVYYGYYGYVDQNNLIPYSILQGH